MKVTALLPLKANSERVKGKNFKTFSGKPLFLWILNTLLKIKQINNIVINTDAINLLKSNGLPQSKKIILRKRKEEICGDYVSMNLIIEDDLKNIDSDIFLMTHTTNPLLSQKSIERAINEFKHALKNNTANSLFSVNKVQERFYDRQAIAVNHDPKKLIRTQDLEAWYKENSNLYLFTKDSFHETNARIGSKPVLFETPVLESVDIDTEEDWALAEVIVNHLKRKGLIDEI